MSQRVQQHAERVLVPPAPPATLKHCWVTAEPYGRLPGLLLAWRRTEAGYQGRVVRPVYDDDGWILVEEWLPAGLLQPAATQ